MPNMGFGPTALRSRVMFYQLSQAGPPEVTCFKISLREKVRDPDSMNLDSSNRAA